VEPVPLKEFRKQKIDILDHTAVIFTSRHAVDHFFAICQELKIEMPADMKYFCISEQTANYLQKYITIRKRKIFTGQKTAQDLLELLKKHKGEKYLFPCSDIRKNDIPDYLRDNGYEYTEAVIYHTVAADLSDLKNVYYDILAFFSPSGINSLYVNFPDFKQNDTRIAAFGPTTAKAVIDAGLILDIEAPLPNAPSMTGALELYIKKANGVK
jgi:uroporphyrinogen-III synthase